MMKFGFNIGLKTLSAAVVLLFPGFITVRSLYAGTVAANITITADTAANQSVRLVLFGFAIGISALLICVIVFKPAARAYVVKWFHKILRKPVSQDSVSPSFLHDETGCINHASSSHTAPPLSKTDDFTRTEEKTPLDDSR